MKNVSEIREYNLCVSCEACNSVCPTDAINMILKNGQFLPEVENSECIHCKKCLSVCYGNNIETEKIDLGNHIDVYDAYVPDEKIRKNSTSGGIVSRLLSALLEDGIVDAVFALDFDNFTGNPVRLQMMRDSKNIYEASGSKYLPASIFNILNKIKVNGSYTVVGTSCQFYGIKEYIKEKELDVDILYFGLFCDRTLNFNFLKYMEDQFGESDENLVDIDYRSKEKRGWPGDVKLYFDSGREVLVNRNERIKVKNYFQLERCLYCIDKLNRKADISFGDCYIHGKDHPERTSVIVRTPKGKKIFNRYSHLFEVNKSSIEGIEIVQGMEERKQHLKRARLLEPGKRISDLRDINRKIKLGRNYSNGKLLAKNRLKLSLKISKLKRGWKYFDKVSQTIVNLLNNSDRSKKSNSGKNILIIGGGLSNKGAQAMTFTVVSNIKKVFPSHEIYLLSSKDFKRDPIEKEKYTFNIIKWDMPWQDDLKLNILTGKEHSYEKILNNTTMILDVSGYRLNSQSNAPYLGSYNYLLDIKIAKKFSIPMYILPQSIGPFNYVSPELPLLWMLQKKYLEYPEWIYPRERAGVKAIKKFTSDNVKRRHDLVLTDDYNVASVFEGSKKDLKVEEPAVGVVPNEKVSRRLDYEVMLNFYEKAIEKLRHEGFVVYLIRHSNPDLSIINDLKNLFPEDKGVIPVAEELYAFELEELISNLKFMISSRYHSIIHAYRNGVPCLVLGWAVKYQELLTDFNQSQYVFDVRNGINTSEILENLEKMMEKHSEESKTVKSKLEKIRRKEGSIFDEIFSDLRDV